MAGALDMPVRIVWRPLARADLIDLYDWIAEQAGPDTAFAYTSGVEATLAPLGDFPMLGTPRDDLAAGVRSLVYRGRTIILYRVVDGAVEVLRLAHSGRDLGEMFGGD
jgi:toxin ParE1/3/4